ncbi:MAG: helix-turn-helix domain-containing protein [Dysgonamonadaceae bacterium]|jgi:hypothetical protein|nr:helix-turn-helix domain-containing protein [Dysgonamonadaceae bacterium]
MITPDSNNPVFQLAADFVNQTSQHIFLTGKAGTGKTTFLKHIRHTTHKNCIVAAPTGVAAINAGGMTLHSLFQLPFEPFVPGMDFRNSKERFRFSAAKRDMLQRLELLIIDEVSMLRADTLDSIDSMLRYIRRSDRPFGGVQMLYIGDMFQLPPVVKEEEWSFLCGHYQSLLFFNSKAVKRVPPVYLELKKIYRQREQSFVDLLNRVRNDELTQDDLLALNRQYQAGFRPPDGEKYITLTTRNAKADVINSRELNRLGTPAYRFEGEIKGEFPEYSLPTAMTLTLKEGAQIMFIKNDTGEDRRYYNGKLGTIACIGKDRIEVRLEGSGDVIAIEKETWKNIRYSLNKETAEIEEEELGSFVQYPIRLAWAITIHKSQGLTFERAIIDTGDAFAPGQAYVALSRCTSLEGIVLLSQITQRSVQTDSQAVQLSKSEKKQAELQQIFEKEKKRFWAERLLLYFDCKDLISIPRNLSKMVEEKISDDFVPAQKLAKSMLEQAYRIQTVAARFQAQLRAIVQQPTEDPVLLTDRCCKAVTYFHQAVIEGMLSPLQQYINGFKIKKAKTFYKNLCGLELDLKLFIENMKKVRYNDIPLAGKLVLPIPEREGLYRTPVKTGEPISKTPEPKMPVNKARPEQHEHPQFEEQQVRIPSARQSFELFRQGLSMKEIAQTRNIGETTVASHLAEFVLSGELPVTDFVPQEKLSELLPWVQAAIAEDNLRLAPIKESVDELFSYNDICFVMSYCLYERNRKN